MGKRNATAVDSERLETKLGALNSALETLQQREASSGSLVVPGNNWSSLWHAARPLM